MKKESLSLGRRELRLNRFRVTSGEGVTVPTASRNGTRRFNFALPNADNPNTLLFFAHPHEFLSL